MSGSFLQIRIIYHNIVLEQEGGGCLTISEQRPLKWNIPVGRVTL